MYIVLNPENNIVALGNETLSLFQATSIVDLYQKLAKDQVEFYINDGVITVSTEISSKQYNMESRDIIGVFGENELIVIKDEITANKEINLNNIAPLKIDFDIEKTSKELGLPKEIVIEFIKSFNEQCHTQIDNLIEAYKIDDIDKIYQIAYKLRLVAKDLFITPIAESLLKLQYNRDIDRVPSLIEKYWAQFISFENQIRNI